MRDLRKLAGKGLTLGARGIAGAALAFMALEGSHV